MKKIIVVMLIMCAALAATLYRQNQTVAAVVPVDPERELYESIRSAGKPAAGKRSADAFKKTQGVEPGTPVVIEGHRTTVQKPRKAFSAARFVCSLPIENTETYTVVLNDAVDAAAAIIKIKKEGCNEITLKSVPSADLFDAIVKTAKQHDMRINA